MSVGKGEIWKTGPWPEWEGGTGGESSRGRQPLTPPPTSSNWGQGDWAPSWSPISPELSSFSQVSGTNEQEEESALRGPRGSLGLCSFWGADPWAERAVLRDESRPPLPLPGGAAAAQGRSPPGTESPWPAVGELPGARAPWLGLLSALAGEGTGGQPRGQSLPEAACAGGTGSLLEGSARQETVSVPPESAPGPQRPQSGSVGHTHPPPLTQGHTALLTSTSIAVSSCSVDADCTHRS